jgi:hypothetical protein
MLSLIPLSRYRQIASQGGARRPAGPLPCRPLFALSTSARTTSCTSSGVTKKGPRLAALFSWLILHLQSGAGAGRSSGPSSRRRYGSVMTLLVPSVTAPFRARLLIRTT